MIMRLDKYLKVSRIIKRRPVAKEVADKMYEIIKETRIEADGEA